MNKRFIGFMVFLTGISLGLKAYEFEVERIATSNLLQERDLFMRFHKAVDKNSDFLSQEFDKEELDYKNLNSETLFFHAIFSDVVIGYISFDIGQDFCVHIRHLAIDPEMYEPALIKELLFAVFQVVPQVSFISLVASEQQADVTALLEELGFEITQKSQDEIFSLYELYVNSKCKICDVLYGSNFWYGNGDEGDWGSYVNAQEPYNHADDAAGW